MNRINIEELKGLVETAWATGFTPEEKRTYVQRWRSDNKEEVREVMREEFDERFTDDYENKDEAREEFVKTLEGILEENT